MKWGRSNVVVVVGDVDDAVNGVPDPVMKRGSEFENRKSHGRRRLEKRLHQK